MLAPRFERGGERDKLVRRHARGRDRYELRASRSERARLVHENRVDMPRRFERFARLDEDAVRRAAPRADHDGDGRREPERARTGDDEDGDDDGECKLRIRAHHEPHAARDEGDCDDRGDKDGGHAVGKARNRRL